jgi:hypothetical protein
MAEITSFIEKTDEIINTEDIPIDMDILEYIYVADIKDILAHDELVELILKTGVYKTTLCDSYGLEELTINYKDIEYTLYGSPKGVPNNYEIFSRANANTKNNELTNINIVTPRKEG